MRAVAIYLSQLCKSLGASVRHIKKKREGSHKAITGINNSESILLRRESLKLQIKKYHHNVY